MTGRSAYLCLQATQQGQASYAHVHEIAQGLRRRGWSVDLYEPPRRRRPQPLARRLVASLVVQLRLLVMVRRYDLVYVRFHPLAVFTGIVSRLLRVPVVVEVNGTPSDFIDVHPALRRFERQLHRLGDACLRRADAIVVVTDELGEWVRSRVGAHRIHVVPNAANRQLFHPDARAGDGAGAPYVCLVGALSPWQGVDTLLAALRDPSWPDDLHVRIVGDGPARARVEAAAASDPRLHYEGVVAYERVGEILAGAEVAVSLKNERAWHASPLKVFEAMACGVPLVVTDQPGQSRIVHEAGCGIVVPTGDAQAVASAIGRLHNDLELRGRLGAAGRRDLEEQHTWDHRAATTARLLAELAGHGDDASALETRRPPVAAGGPVPAESDDSD
jgi:glycosyltransferase involved in cell wall biosynthesis